MDESNPPESALEPTPEEIDRLQAAHTRHLRFNRLCWLLWIGGTVLIVLSWTDTVSPEVGWAGYAVALAGMVLSRIAFRYD